jgi:hypothetical protein
MGRGRHRVDVHHGDGAEDQEWWQKPRIAAKSPPSWRAKCRSGFGKLPQVLLPEQPVVVLLLGRALVSWLSAMDEHDEQADFCGSGCRSAIPYIHG